MLTNRTGYICLSLILFLIAIVACGRNVHDKKSLSDSTILLQDNIDSIYKSYEKYSNDTTILQAELEKNIHQNDKIQQLVLHKRLGEIHLGNYNFKSSIKNHHEYFKLSEELNDSLQTLTALNRLAFVYKKACLLNNAINFYFKALKLSDNLGDSPACVLKEKVNTYYEIGDIYSMFGYFDEALMYFKESYRYGESLEDKKSLADNRLGIGFVFQEKKLYDSARISYNKAIDLNIEANSESGIALSFLRLGNLRIEQEFYQEAIIYLNSAYQTLSNSSDKLNFMEICFALGDANIKLMNYAEAERYLSEGVEVAKQINLPYYLETAYSKFSALYDAQNKTDIAAQNLILAHRHSNLMNRNAIRADLFNSYIEYENEKKTNQILKLKSEYESKNNRQRTIITFSIIVITLLILAFLIYYQLLLRKTQKDKLLVETVKLKSDLYTKITHELKTPITIIIGMIKKLKETINEEKSTYSQVDLEILERQSENLLFLVNEILSVSKIRSNDNIHRVNENIVDYLRYLHSCYADFVKTKKITYLFQSSSDKIIMNYSKEQIRVIVNNLLTNSIKHCTEGNKILLTVKEANNKKCIIEVIDDGTGIEAKDIPHIFETFYQGESVRPEQPGAGIGLAHTKQVVESLNGKIFVRSTPGKETVFTVEIPMENSAHPSETEPLHQISYVPEHHDEKQTKTEEKEEESKKISILIVEDNLDMIFYLTSILKNEYDIITARDGKEALSLANEESPDIIITDLIMPRMDGAELCTHLKSSDLTNHIPIIVLTAKASDEERIQSISSGADAYLTKPFIEEELKAKINQLFNSRKELVERYSQIVLDKQNIPLDLTDNSNLEFLQKVTDIIHRELKNNDFFPHGLADEMKISSSHLNKKIKAISGLNTTSYILLVRLNRAKKLLATSQKPIGEIALDCGFNDFSYFSKSFKKEFGITPSKFQRLPL